MKKEMDIIWQNAADIILLDAPGGGNAPILGGEYAAGGEYVQGGGCGYKPAKLVPGGGN